MAEYIDREKIIPHAIDDDYEEGGERLIVEYEYIEEIPTADVVEREEYIELLKENERLRGDLEFKSEALNSIGQIHKEYVSKIDKAIKEMQGYLTTKPSNRQWIEGINYAREILKRNIGE